MINFGTNLYYDVRYLFDVAQGNKDTICVRDEVKGQLQQDPYIMDDIFNDLTIEADNKDIDESVIKEAFDNLDIDEFMEYVSVGGDSLDYGETEASDNTAVVSFFVECEFDNDKFFETLKEKENEGQELD